MVSKARITAVVLLTMASSACIGRGGNIRSNFQCRAPNGTCAPTRVIDAGAAQIGKQAEPAPSELATARTRAGVAEGDIARTAERTLRIVFPAHVDASGTLHDEAVAWAVVERPRWAAELRRDHKDAGSVLQTLRTRSDADPADDTRDAASAAELPSSSPFSIASPLVLPSTAREAIAGASAPAVEGFDMVSPAHDRTPRPFVGDELTYPTPEAIAAAHAKSAPAASSAPLTNGAPPAPTPEHSMPKEKQ